MWKVCAAEVSKDIGKIPLSTNTSRCFQLIAVERAANRVAPAGIRTYFPPKSAEKNNRKNQKISFNPEIVW